MFKVIFLLLSSIFVTSSFAAGIPTCKIVTLNDAKACMAKVAKAYPDYEQANESMVSANTASLIKVLKALGLKDQYIKAVKADFVGAMLEHGDEHHIYYFSMKKGSSKPVEVYDLNLVDLASSLVTTVTVKDLFLGTSFNGADVKEDIQEAIKEFNSNN